MTALETDLSEKSQQVNMLQKARESDRDNHDNMQAKICDLEQMCEKYRTEIEALEKYLMESDGIINKHSQQNICEKLNEIKITQSTRMSIMQISSGCKARIDAIKDKQLVCYKDQM